MTVVPVEGEVTLSAQEVQTKEVNALEKSPDAGVEVCMGSDGNPQWQVLLTGCGYTAEYKVSVNLLGVTESKHRESDTLQFVLSLLQHFYPCPA